MNQILTVENKKKNKNKARSSKSIEIKGIVRFFAFVIAIFGIVLIGEGTYAFVQEKEDLNPANKPKVSLGRINDTVILNVTHTTEISKVIYSWDNGEETELPQGGLTATEEILLPNQNSVLNIKVIDMKGKEVSYQKEYVIEGMDITKPNIEIKVADGSKKMTITVTDETEIAYLSYKWEGEEEVVIEQSSQGQTQIKKEIDLTPGTRKITIIAEDMNSNIEKIEKEIIATKSEPKMQVIQDGKQIIIEASDEDGIKDIALNLNGKKYKSQNINQKYVKVGPVELQEGNNTIAVEVTNINGYTKKAATEIKY